MTTKASRWITPKEASEKLGLTVRQLANLADQGMDARVGPGGHRQYKWPECREWYFQARRDSDQAELQLKYGGSAADPDAAKARLANAQADKTEFEVARLRGEYVSIAYHARELEAQAGRLVQPLNAMRGRFRDRSLGLSADSVDAFWDAVEDWLRAGFHSAVEEHDTDDSDPADEPSAEAA